MKPQVVWIGIILSLLAMSFGIHAVLIVAAVNDPSFAVEPDYERKAADWDEHQRQQAINRDLGWTVDVATERRGVNKDIDVSLSLFDRYGKPILGARIDLVAFHNARANQVHRATLAHVAEELYGTRMPLERPGVWEFRLTVEHDGDHFTRTLRKTVGGAAR